MKMNVIIIYDLEEKNLLMCQRAKEPYKGLYNLVGGHIEDGEAGLESAYRELEEETGITKEDTILTHLMDFKYHMPQEEVQVYVGKLNKKIDVVVEAHELHWISVDDDFFDMNKYAGEGNIGHMIEHVKYNKDQVLRVK